MRLTALLTTTVVAVSVGVVVTVAAIAGSDTDAAAEVGCGQSLTPGTTINVNVPTPATGGTVVAVNATSYPPNREAGGAASLVGLVRPAAVPGGNTVGGGSSGVNCSAGYHAGERTGGADAAWDPGNIISDEVMYDATAMSDADAKAFIVDQGQDCPDSNALCLKNYRSTYPAQPSDEFCSAVAAGTDEPVWTMLVKFSVACGINPQVMLVTLQKESALLNRTSPSASNYAHAFGWGCPDTGPGGSAACSDSSAGFFNQGYGMAKQWARYRKLIPEGRYRYGVGTYDIMWNVAESGCGSAPVTIKNIATASLYVYTPYQPNQAALDAYPGEGDGCSAYGNRNFFRLFQKYFGDTGGGIVAVSYTPVATGGSTTVPGPLGPIPVTLSGNVVVVPDHPDVPAGMRGQQIVAATPQIAGAIAAGMTWLGTSYSWGGGGADGPTTGIDSGAGTVGFDCSGLTRFVASKWGASIPHVSGGQRDLARAVPWDQALPGDIVGYDGHVTIYLGTFGGVRMELEAPQTGLNVRVSDLGRNPDGVVYRYWGGVQV